MSDDSLWSRVRKARLIQILAVYLGVSWVILQVVGELREALQLPAWIGPVSLILLVIGLVIILATAWVQSHPLVARRAAEDEVPGSWEVALGQVKDSLVRGELPHLTWGRALLGGVFAFSLLFGFAGLYVLIKDRGESFAPTPALAEGAAPGIAVLPFTVTDPELEEWREGMVNLLSTNLDGAGGLRAIDSRTVLARWDELASGDARADLAGSLAVARAAGARHALLGSVVSGGGGLRLTAEVYDVETGASLDRVRADGPLDSIFSLVDRLSIDVLQAVLPDVEGEFAGVRLARVTTASLPALRAFLEGEALFRRSRFDEAIPAYERALEADSGFALAAARLSNAYGWAESIGSELGLGAIERAVRHAERLPERERLLVLAERSLLAGTLGGMESLRLAVRRYPDDPEAWYLLGDTYFHLGPQALVSMQETEEAFRRAVELDPSFTPAHIHLVDMAFLLDPDSVRARARMHRYGELAAGAEAHRRLELAFGLAFGDSAARAAARAALDTTTVSLTGLAVRNLFHARFLGAFSDVAAELRERGHPLAPVFEFLAASLVGRFTEATNALADPGYPAVARLMTLARLRAETTYLKAEPPAPSWAAEALARAAADTANPFHAFAGGAYAVESGSEREVGRSAATLRAAAGRLLQAGDTLGSRYAAGAARALEGMAALREGDAERGARLLEQARTGATASSPPGSMLNAQIRWWEARLAVERGRTEEAKMYLRSLALDPVAQLHLGRLHDEAGEAEEAIEAYRYFITAWHDPDPEFDPLVEEIRQRIAALMDAPASS